MTAAPPTEGAPFDLLIEGGLVLDGTGAAGFHAAVAIRGDRVHVLRGDVARVRALRRIHAAGLVVAPGFIDLHSHSGLMILADPRHEPKVRQGVTTEVIGVDGNSYAPFPRVQDLHAFVHLNAGLDGRPDLPYDWDSAASYLARFDRAVALNIAFLVGNSALRASVIGWDDVPANRRHVADMKAMLREAMEEGAYGVSSGLDYPPGAYATTAELAALTAAAARHGGLYHTHVRYALGDRFLDPFREAIEIGRRGGGPVHITHFYHRRTFPGGPDEMLGLVMDARAEGLDVSYDSYPYEWASTRLLIMLPPWVQAGGPGPLRERLADGAIRERLREEIEVRGTTYAGRSPWDDLRLGYLHQPHNQRWEGRTLGELMRDRGQDVVDAVCELLLDEDLSPNQVTPGPWSETLGRFVAHPLGMFGTDSTFVGEKPSPRTYGSFPRVLGEFVRDLRLLTLEEAVRKMTSAPAARLGLADRGILRDGLKADLVVFDPVSVRSLATYDEPRAFPAGIPYVVVNGTLVVDRGEHTGALPGRALRRGRPDA